MGRLKRAAAYVPLRRLGRSDFPLRLLGPQGAMTKEHIEHAMTCIAEAAEDVAPSVASAVSSALLTN